MEFMNFTGGSMKNIANIQIKNVDESIKYGYAFMKSTVLNKKECAFINPNPTQFEKGYIAPKDFFSATYIDNTPIWEEFKTNQKHISSIGMQCVGCLDKYDRKRVMLVSFQNKVMFNCYGNYEDDAKKAFEEVKKIYSSLK